MMVTMRRFAQVAIWFLLGPILGLVQGLASFLPVVLQGAAFRESEALRTFLIISVWYGTSWFVPAAVLNDAIFLRRALGVVEFAGFVAIVAVVALACGLAFPGMLIMVGYPVTAFAILLTGYAYRRQSHVSTG